LFRGEPQNPGDLVGKPFEVAVQMAREGLADSRGLDGGRDAALNAVETCRKTQRLFRGRCAVGQKLRPRRAARELRNGAGAVIGDGVLPRRPCDTSPDDGGAPTSG